MNAVEICHSMREMIAAAAADRHGAAAASP